MTFGTTFTGAVGLTFAAAILISGLSACAPTPEQVIEPTPTFSDEAEAFAAAERTYIEYIDALNQVDLSDPATFENVWAWSSGDLNSADRKSLTEYSAEGVEIRGKSVIASIAPVNSVGGDQVQLAVCLNVSTFDLLDASGRSLVSDSRSDLQSLSVGLARSTASPTGLLVEAIEQREGTPLCD